MNSNKTTKVSTKQRTPPIANVLLPAVLSTVFEQYEFKGWLITIEGAVRIINDKLKLKYNV